MVWAILAMMIKIRSVNIPYCLWEAGIQRGKEFAQDPIVRHFSDSIFWSVQWDELPLKSLIWKEAVIIKWEVEEILKDGCSASYNSSFPTYYSFSFQLRQRAPHLLAHWLMPMLPFWWENEALLTCAARKYLLISGQGSSRSRPAPCEPALPAEQLAYF